jgi:hypothetical protein
MSTQTTLVPGAAARELTGATSKPLPLSDPGARSEPSPEPNESRSNVVRRAHLSIAEHLCDGDLSHCGT